ncbi:MAG: lipid-A-disaccharide synthase [Casimicrobium sp.]
MKQIVIVAGEASGDQLAAHLVEEVRSVDPSVKFYGVCGPKMRAAGVEQWFDCATLSVRGYAEVLSSLPRILRLKRELLAKIQALKPNLYIGVDAPDFNLRIEKQVKASGVKTMHYVCPSFWAWRPERAKKFHQSLDHMLCVFPFEPELLAKHNVAASFVGHPMARGVSSEANKFELRRSFTKFKDDPTVEELIAVLPGSRISELNFHAELFVNTIETVARERPNARFLVPLVNRETRAIFEAALWAHGAAIASKVDLLFGHADFALRTADVGLIASGTASLEAAIHGCPHVVTYRISAMTYAMVKRKLLLPYVSLPNILEKNFLVPEFLQKEATVANLSKSLLELLASNERRTHMIDRFTAIRASLQAPVAQPFADAVLKVL